VFYERAKHNPNIVADECYIDAFSLNLLRKPWDYDVCPMENQFGDITSDLAAGLICGMGFAPSADIGPKHGVFQPSHGSAPDIAGKGIANPTATILSAALMLDWLAEKHGDSKLADAAESIERAVDKVFSNYIVKTPEIGGTDGTSAVARAVIEAL
jgi:3-isopropylmalate dehydrogenase